MWGNFQALAEAAKKAAKELDEKLNESVGIPQEPQVTPVANNNSAVHDENDALNDGNWDDEEDVTISRSRKEQSRVAEEEDENESADEAAGGWDEADDEAVEFEDVDISGKPAVESSTEDTAVNEGGLAKAQETPQEKPLAVEELSPVEDQEASPMGADNEPPEVESSSSPDEASPEPAAEESNDSGEEIVQHDVEETAPGASYEPTEEKSPSEQARSLGGLFGGLARLAVGDLKQLAEQALTGDEAIPVEEEVEEEVDGLIEEVAKELEADPAMEQPAIEHEPKSPAEHAQEAAEREAPAEDDFPDERAEPEKATEETAAVVEAEPSSHGEEKVQLPFEGGDIASLEPGQEDLARIMEQQAEYTRIMERKMEELQKQLSKREEQLFSKTEQMTMMETMFEDEKQELLQKVQNTKEEAKRRIQKAKECVESMEQRLKNATASQSSSAEGAGKQAELIAALREEGQKLARKQADMEAAVRAAKGEARQLRETLEDVAAANTTAEAKIAKLETELKATKDDLASARRGESLSDKLDADLRAAREESEKRAATILSLEQHAKELKAAQKELKKELEETKKGAATESEQERKKLLKEHADLVSDLEAKLRASEREAGVREDALRHEVDELRKRWQDAVRRADSLSVDVQSSTAPLLRQLESTNKQNRARAAAWAELETQLRTELEENVIENEKLSKERSEMKTKCTRLERSNKEYESELKQLKGSLHDKTERVAQLEHKLEDMETEGAKKKSEWAEVERLANEGVSRVRSEMTRTVVDAEERHRSQLDSLQAQLRKEREQRDQLEKQVESLLENSGMFVPDDSSSPALAVVKESKPKKLRRSEGQAEILSGALGLVSDGEQSDDDEDDENNAPSDGGGSFAGLQQLTSRLRASKVELATLRDRLKESEKTREDLVKLLAESRNAREKLPLFEAKVQELVAENKELKQEVDGLREDITDIKDMYRAQLNVLLEEKAASSASFSNGSSNEVTMKGGSIARPVVEETAVEEIPTEPAKEDETAEAYNGEVVSQENDEASSKSADQ